jgi:hypothetical protein
MQDDETHPGIDSVADRGRQPVGHLVVVTMPPPDEHVGFGEARGRSPCSGSSSVAVVTSPMPFSASPAAIAPWMPSG